MAGRNPGRYLAPVALIVVIVAVVLVVRARTETDRKTVVAHTTAALPATPPSAPKPAFYVIKPGDSLSSISVKTNVAVATLEALNPSLDPNALQAGQRIRLRR